MRQNDLKLCSQRLAYILRHSKTIERQFGGWINISDVIDQSGYQPDVIDEIVRMDKKGRFEFDKTNNLIRALYGHSVEVNMGYTEVKPPSMLLHGTATYATQQILQDGLNPRSRQFVHLTDDLDMAISTGKRHGDSSILSIEAKKMYEDGYKFYNPVPNVWLVSSVPVKYIETMGEIFEEVNENLLNHKQLCVVNIDDHEITLPKSLGIRNYSDLCHISQYRAKDSYRLIILLVNEYDDWQKWRSNIMKIKAESPNFLLFYTYEVREELDIDVPYIRTTLNPEVILKIMDSILYGGDPLPISFNDFIALLLRGGKTGVLSSFNVYDAYRNNQFLDYIKRHDNKRKNMIIHFTIPTRANDSSQFAACIQDSLASIPSNIDFVWGCSFVDDSDLSVSIFVQ